MVNKHVMVKNFLMKFCKYGIHNLQPYCYIFDETNVKSIKIDNGRAYVQMIHPSPTILSGFSISFNETTSLDERYRFTKSVVINVAGKADITTLVGRKLYVILEGKNGKRYLFNPDFKANLQYTFNVGENQNQTEITFQTSSNYPTLVVDHLDVEKPTACSYYALNGILKVEMIEQTKARLDRNAKIAYLTENLKDIEHYKNSAMVEENFDGEKITNTLQFALPLSSFDDSFPYNLLEFFDNVYFAKVTTKDNKIIYIENLQPQYNVEASSNVGNSDTVTITLTAVGRLGVVVDEIEEQKNEETYWDFVRYIGNVKTYECSGGPGLARHLMMAEFNALGYMTGKYKMVEDVYECLQDPDDDWCHENYDGLLQFWNDIVGTFENVTFPRPNTNYFPTIECAYREDEHDCTIETNMPNTIVLSGTSLSFDFMASCNWSITPATTAVTASPATGEGGTNYTITITSNVTPSTGSINVPLAVLCCASEYNYNVNIQAPISCIRPQETTIDCLQQTISFEVNCDNFYVDSITKDGSVVSDITTTKGYNTLNVTIPQNTTSDPIQYVITVSGCCNGTATINQTKQYSDWIVEDGEYICQDGAKYEKVYLWTGTSTTTLVKTSTFRIGSLIQTHSRDCWLDSRWSWLGHYICLDAEDEHCQKYRLMEEEYTLDGVTWQTTGHVKLGDFVAIDCDFCNQTTTITWVLTDEILCL